MVGPDLATTSPILDLAKGITDSAFVLDPERKILEFNRAFVSTHKIDRRQLSEIKGSFCRNHVRMEICENECILKKCLESGATVRFDEVKGKTPAGEELNL